MVDRFEKTAENRVVLFDLTQPAADELTRVLGKVGWSGLAISERGEMLALIEGRPPAAVVIDGDEAAAGETIAAIRHLPPPANGTPILLLGGEAVPLGAGGHLLVPLDPAGFLDLLREWAGPLDALALRGAPYTPRYRLIRLLGLTAADAMRARFHDALRDAVSAAGRDPDAVPAHRLAGIAGMLGESEVGALWSRVDRGEAGALPLAIEASSRALGE